MFFLVTGGSGSGKSEFAEELTVKLGGEKTYIAAMIPSGEESLKKIERHRRARAGKGFVTVECHTSVKTLTTGGTALLECMSNLLANEMYSPGGSGANAVSEILAGVDKLSKQCEALIIVTNEVFSDGIEYDPETIRYMKNLGAVNRRLAVMADVVYEVTYGYGNKIKGKE